MTVLAIAVVATGPIAEQIGNIVGLGDAAVTAWNIAKWPVMLVVVAFMLAFLYWAAPNVEHPKFRWVSPGGIVAVVLWIAARRCSRSTSRTSRRTRPTARSAASSRS